MTKLFVQDGCLGNWAQRKTIHGDQLSSQTQISQWVPTSETDWTTVHVTNITSNFYTSDFRFKFEFESDNGNNFYLDNINIYEGAPSDDIVGLDEAVVTELNAYPNPTDDELNISYFVNTGEVTNVRLLDVSGKEALSHKVVSQAGKNVIVLDTNPLANGVYIAEVEVQGVKYQMRVIVQ